MDKPFGDFIAERIERMTAEKLVLESRLAAMTALAKEMQDVYCRMYCDEVDEDGTTEYRVFATDGSTFYPLIGSVVCGGKSISFIWHEDGGCVSSDYAIPPGDLAPLLSGVIEAKEKE